MGLSVFHSQHSPRSRQMRPFLPAQAISSLGVFCPLLAHPGDQRQSKATISETADKGLVKKMENLPFDMINDCLREDSHMGPRTKAMTMGAPS